MTTLTLHADPFGAAMSRAGDAMLRRLANAQIVIGGAQVVGLLAVGTIAPNLGGLQVQGSTLRFDCLAADLPAGIDQGSLVTIGADSYVVALRTPHADLGQVQLDLERA